MNWLDLLQGITANQFPVQSPRPVAVPPELPQVENPYLEQYSQHLGTMPSREQYQPSKWRRLGAILAGTATLDPGRAFELSQRVVEAPYSNALEDWSNKGKALYSQAMLGDKSQYRDIQYQRNQIARYNALRQNVSQGLRDDKTMAEIAKIEQELQRSGYQRFVDDKGVEWMVNPYTNDRFQLGMGRQETPAERAEARRIPTIVAGIHEAGANTRQQNQLDYNENRDFNNFALNLYKARQPQFMEMLNRVSVNYPYFRAALDKAMTGQQLTDEEQISYQDGMRALGSLMGQVPPPPTFRNR